MADTRIKQSVGADYGGKAPATLSMRLDAERNENKSEFAYGSTAYFQVFSWPSDMALDFAVSDGSLSGAGSGTAELTEDVSFDDSDRGSTEAPILQILSYRWLGRDLGPVTGLGGNTLKAATSGLAMLRITYNADFKRYGLFLASKTEAEWPVLIRAKGISANPQPSASLTVNFKGDGSTLAHYILTVKDKCNNEPLTAVVVNLDGHSAGQTGGDGKIDLGQLVIGSTHKVVIDRAGYRRFEAEFTVPEPEVPAPAGSGTS
jgi:hypothetical protein